MPREERGWGTMRYSGAALIHVLGLCLAATSAWGLYAPHPYSILRQILEAAIWVLTPVLFWLLGRASRRYRAKWLLAWPGVVMAEWILVPGIAAWSHWDAEAAVHVMLRQLRWPSLVYYIVCILSVTVASLLGRRRRGKETVSHTDNDGGGRNGVGSR